MLERALAGEEIIITSSGRPMMRLVPARRGRKPNVGLARGEIAMAPDVDDIPDGFAPYLG